MTTVLATLSMLHEPIDVHSGTRRFRGEPVLRWTLKRLQQSRCIDSIHILCWEDQAPAVAAAADGFDINILNKGPRQSLAALQSVSAARRWADGWRGGLLGSCEFDLGFHGPWMQEMAAARDADGVLLIDPAAGLLDPLLIEALVEHSEAEPEAELVFSQAAPGLSGVLLRRALLDRLAVARIHPGRLLTYWPDNHGVDPIGRNGCAAVATPVARTLHRFKLDSQRQIDRLESATASLNGQLIRSDAETLVQLLNGAPAAALPRDVTLEINTQRATSPCFWPGRHLAIDRPALQVEQAKALITQLAEVDDIRLTFAGVGDPLLSPAVFDLLDVAHAAGVAALHVETDLLPTDPAVLVRLAQSPVDVVSVHLPTASAGTYQAVMNHDGFARVMQNLALLEQAVAKRGSGTPLIVPVFTKLPQNLAEMDAWYDYWQRRLGHAVIAGPSDYAGQIPGTAVADMAPPRRRPCARLSGRMTILCDGTVVSCEQDVLGVQSQGRLTQSRLPILFEEECLGQLRQCHADGRWDEQPLCRNCREWHRP